MPLSGTPLIYTLAALVDLPALRTLVERVFLQFEAPDYPLEGTAEFLKYIDLHAWLERMTGGAFVFECKNGEFVVGMIEIRQGYHLSLLFVDGNYHRQGIARHLWQLALQHCLELNPNLEKITVNSSPYARKFYKKIGFIPTAGKQQINGIIFYPMEFRISK